MYIDVVSGQNFPNFAFCNAGAVRHRNRHAVYRVPALAPSPTVTWHPSKYVLVYCGQTKMRGGLPPVAVISMFGSLE